MNLSKKKFWIQKAVKKKGTLSRQLQIPEKENIPKTLLREIKKTPIGKTIRNPTKKGKRRIKVTRLLKKRAVLGLTLKEIKK
jgi:hypothetical protein